MILYIPFTEILHLSWGANLIPFFLCLFSEIMDKFKNDVNFKFKEYTNLKI